MTTHFTAVECLDEDEHLWWFMWHLLEYVDVLAKKLSLLWDSNSCL